MANNRKKVSLEDLDGLIIKNRVRYSLVKGGERRQITNVGLIELIEEIDIEKHNAAYLENLKKRLEEYDEDGYNFLGFNKDGLYRDGSRYSKKGFDCKGWRKSKDSVNALTYTDRDLYGRDFDGYDIEGYDIELFNREGIHKVTGTIYDEKGFTKEGIDKEGYNREGLNSRGKTREDVKEQRQQQTKTYLGLISLANEYAKGSISTEEYLKKHKITIEELIDFAKKQHLSQDVILGLYKKKGEYKRYHTKFSKSEYLRDKTIIQGVIITEEMVDKVVAHLKSNDRYLSWRLVSDTLVKYVKGEIMFGSPESRISGILNDTIEMTKETVGVNDIAKQGNIIENPEREKGVVYGENN